MNLDSLNKKRDQLTDLENAVLDYLIDIRNQINVVTIKEVAECLFVSTSTITRLSQKMGFSGFKELKYTLSKIDDNGMSGFELDDEECERLFSQFRSTLELVETAAFEKLIQMIKNGKKIELFAVGGSYPVALDFTKKLQGLGFDADLRSDWDDLIRVSKMIGMKDVAIFLSFSGETKLIKELLNNVKQTGASMIGFTSSSESTLAQQVDISLILEGDSFSFEDADLNNRMSYYVVTDLIVKELYKIFSE